MSREIWLNLIFHRIGGFKDEQIRCQRVVGGQFVGTGKAFPIDGGFQIGPVDSTNVELIRSSQASTDYEDKVF